MNKGFTLIELLVVVLIIGILAAIALPQYTKAVERSRISEAAQRLGDMATAAQVHFMQTGSYPASAGVYATGTDVTFATLETNSFTVGANGGTLTAGRKNGRYQGNGLQITLSNDGSMEKSCIRGSNNPDEFCQMAQGFGY